MPREMGEYYKRVDDYDLEYQSQSQQDLPFWRELVSRYAPKHLLELACGSGRIGLDLLHNSESSESSGSFLLEGLDIDQGMLQAYRRKLAQEPAAVQQRVTLHAGDMSEYDLPHKGEFDLILLPFNSISHLYEVEQQIDTFRLTYEQLAPGGCFVVDTFLPDIDYLSDALNRPSTVYLEDEVESPDGDFTMMLYTTRTYDTLEQTQHLTYVHEKFLATGENERYFSKLDMHVFFPRELQMLFLATGFHVEAIYGDYKWQPLGHGTRQIVVGRKPRDAQAF
jgi:SAM-dependent methyltransferase